MQHLEKNEKPSIYEYTNFRVYLKALYDHFKSETSHFSYRYFSQRAGFSSPNFLKLVIEGKRNLSPASTEKFIFALKMTKSEGEFFKGLVQFGQSKSPAERSRAASLLLKSKAFKSVYPLKDAELKYYAKWYYIPIRELVGTNIFKEDLNWIGKRFRPELKKSEVKEALEDLLLLGLLYRDESGNLKQSYQNISTQSEVASSLVSQYHKEMIRKASDSIDEIHRSQREISGTCISCSPLVVDKIKEMVREFRKEVMAVAAQDQGANRVYQLNFQLFPLVFNEESEK
ncbi:MAG: hypothetical protein CL676_03390 [Bdellovibrionaceae bacterium]|nr:hypothetical protein [Pseudobdellovibrionaceae bacterium]|tara:strand:- start:964 stop:1821 length:858 start_codon:yes stop_codon:yes gene_type:complete